MQQMLPYILILANSTLLLIAYTCLRLPKYLIIALTALPIFHLIITHLSLSRIRYLPILALPYPTSQLLFLISLTITLMIKNYIHRYLLVFVICLQIFATNLYFVDYFIHNQNARVGLILFLGLQNLAVIIGLLFLIRVSHQNTHSYHQRPPFIYTEKYIVYLFTVLGTALSILIYSAWLSKTHISEIIKTTKLAISLAVTRFHTRHNNHQLGDGQNNLGQLYEIYWIISCITSSMVVGTQYSVLLQYFDGKLGDKDEQQKYEKIEGEDSEQESRKGVDEWEKGVGWERKKIFVSIFISFFIASAAWTAQFWHAF